MFQLLSAQPTVLFEHMTLDTAMRCIIVAVVSYLLGSFNFGIIITDRITKKDIRNMGSGNAGATNVMRSVGVGPAILTFLCDCLKGVLAILFGWWLFSGVKAGTPQTQFEYIIYGKYLAGLFVILGHMFPLYYKFKGGKGVATTFATIMMIQWRVGLILLGVFIIVVLITRYVSLGSMIAAFLYGFVTFIFEYSIDYLGKIGDDSYLITPRLILVSTFCAFTIGYIVVLKHYENIYRLTRHEEKKISFKRKSKDTAASAGNEADNGGNS